MSDAGQPFMKFRGPKGAPIEVHASVLVLALIFTCLTGSFRDVHFDTLFFGLVVGSLILHELGHAWACEVLGLRVRRIVVHGGGGSCIHFGEADRTQQEFIAMMGPLSSLAIWAIASLLWPMLEWGVVAWMLVMTAKINLFLAILNLLPMNPLDGGKLFQLVLRRILPEASVQRLSGICGACIAILWIPTMVLCFLTYGVTLFLLPSIRAQWNGALV